MSDGTILLAEIVLCGIVVLVCEVLRWRSDREFSDLRRRAADGHTHRRPGESHEQANP